MTLLRTLSEDLFNYHNLIITTLSAHTIAVAHEDSTIDITDTLNRIDKAAIEAEIKKQSDSIYKYIHKTNVVKVL